MNQSKGKFMSKILVTLQTVVTISMLGCAGGDDAITGERADIADERDQAGNAIDLIAPSASGTWVVSPDEFCAEFFPPVLPPNGGPPVPRVCTSTFPAPQCDPTVVAGQACSPAGANQCFKTITIRKFRIFDCV